MVTREPARGYGRIRPNADAVPAISNVATALIASAARAWHPRALSTQVL